MLIETVLAHPDAELVGVLDRTGSPLEGQDAGAFVGRNTGICITGDVDLALTRAEYLIDFTRPEATLAYLEAVRRHGVKLIVGTTGFTEAELARLGGLLAPLEQDETPFAGSGVPRAAHFVAPRLVAEVRFAEWTDAGRIRQPAYLGLRDDKNWTDVVREV